MKLRVPRRRLPDAVLASQTSKSGRTSRLLRQDGRLVCECPWLCDATSEVCDFETHPAATEKRKARK